MSEFYSNIQRFHQILQKIEKHTREGDLVSAKVWFDNLQMGMKELENQLKSQPEPGHEGEIVAKDVFDQWVDEFKTRVPGFSLECTINKTECGSRCIRGCNHLGKCFTQCDKSFIKDGVEYVESGTCEA